jgi:hypothetical protein
MKLNRITLIFMITVLAIGILADIAFAYFWGEPGTISAQMWQISHDYPIVTFSSGLLMGHLFWHG